MNNITGYKQLSDEQVADINDVKECANLVGDIVAEFINKESIDQRWVAIAKTHLQQGFMALTRSIANPDSF
ncbi:DUF7681 family protein [Acinetobacter ursingii]|uniref:Acb2/Tad1 domain-containing protein n=1 Tax=Acinetobacter ursingii TaxID=108980 RepID=UPI00300A95A9